MIIYAFSDCGFSENETMVKYLYYCHDCCVFYAMPVYHNMEISNSMSIFGHVIPRFLDIPRSSRGDCLYNVGITVCGFFFLRLKRKYEFWKLFPARNRARNKHYYYKYQLTTKNWKSNKLNPAFIYLVRIFES